MRESEEGQENWSFASGAYSIATAPRSLRHFFFKNKVFFFITFSVSYKTTYFLFSFQPLFCLLNLCDSSAGSSPLFVLFFIKKSFINLRQTDHGYYTTMNVWVFWVSWIFFPIFFNIKGYKTRSLAKILVKCKLPYIHKNFHGIVVGGALRSGPIWDGSVAEALVATALTGWQTTAKENKLKNT